MMCLVVFISLRHSWELVYVPKYKYVISVKWIYKTKQDVDGNVEKHKARMIARGFTQQLDIDFNETFSSFTRMGTVRKFWP